LADSAKYSYQLYTSFLNEARRHEQAGTEGAWKLYLHAARCLLEVAGQTQGETKDSQLKQVEQLIARAGRIKPGAKKAQVSEGQPAEKEEGTQVFAPVTVPGVSFDDIAGLEDVKREVFERVIRPMQKPELYKQYRIKAGGGILMFGLPGTGKTMIARAIAHEVNAPFYHVRGSDLKDKWVGSSERNIAQLFEQVRSEPAAVLFLDEFDGIGGKADDAGGSTRGISAELKSQMDGFDKDQDRVTLLLGATNHPWSIDTAFLRSGRFSRMIYVPLPDAPARAFLLRQQFRDVPMDASVDFEALTQSTRGFSGADMVQYCDKVKILAATRADAQGEVSNVTMEDFHRVSAEFRSTVIAGDIALMKEFMLQNSFKIPESM
jgi:transitional endoplasmic reticulum ATPase